MTVQRNRARSGWQCITAAVLLGVSVHGVAHGGGKDDRGCHRDTQAGNYHCHSGPHAGQTFDSPAHYPGRDNVAGSSEPAERAGHDQNTSARSTDYDRDDYHSRWLDRDDDCQDTREEVLIRQSREPVQFETSRQCNVVAGLWYDPYSDKTFTDPSNLHIDHLVPLAEAHRSGAGRWPDSRKHTYANDLETQSALIAVAAGQNMSKSDRGPSQWMPANDDYHCDYLKRWVGVKQRWDLAMDPAEARFVRSEIAQCPTHP